MKAELFKRLFYLQQEKLSACLEYQEQLAYLFTRNIKLLPKEVKDEYIAITRPFIEKYNELLGEEGTDEEEEKE